MRAIVTACKQNKLGEGGIGLVLRPLIISYSTNVSSCSLQLLIKSYLTRFECTRDD